MPTIGVKYIFGNKKVLEYFESSEFPVKSRDAQIVRTNLCPLLISVDGKKTFLKDAKCDFGLLVIDHMYLLPTTVSKPLGWGEKVRNIFCSSANESQKLYNKTATSGFFRYVCYGIKRRWKRPVSD